MNILTSFGWKNDRAFCVATKERCISASAWAWLCNSWSRWTWRETRTLWMYGTGGSNVIIIWIYIYIYGFIWIYMVIYGDCMAVVILLLLLSLLLVYDHHIIRIYSIIHLIFTIVKYSESSTIAIIISCSWYIYFLGSGSCNNKKLILSRLYLYLEQHIHRYIGIKFHIMSPSWQIGPDFWTFQKLFQVRRYPLCKVYVQAA